MAISSKELSGGGIPAGGYGVYFGSAGDTSYLIYADSGDEEYDSVEVVETINLEQGTNISSLSQNNLSINFKPPDPTIKLSGSPPPDEVTIILTLITDTSKTKTIKVNKAGRIEIE
jgi:hypothetical protein